MIIMFIIGIFVGIVGNMIFSRGILDYRWWLFMLACNFVFSIVMVAVGII